MRQIAFIVAAVALCAPASALAEPVDDPPPPQPLSPEEPVPGPSIVGTAQEGQVLTAQQGGWQDAELTNDWRRCGEAVCQSTGQNGNTYTLTSADVGSRIKLRVRGESMFNTARFADSPLTAVVSAAPPPPPPPPPPTPPANTSRPAVTGEVREGSTLSASRGTWSGTEPITYSYEWFRCATGCEPTGQRGTTYALTAADVRHRISVIVTAQNAGGSATAVASTSSAVAALPDPAVTTALLSPFPVVIVGGRVMAGGAVITQLLVRGAPRQALVEIRCSGADCPFRRARRRTTAARRLRIPALERRLRTGTLITITVRRGQTLGKYTRIRIRGGRPPSRLDRCVSPGSRKPRRCPAAS